MADLLTSPENDAGLPVIKKCGSGRSKSASGGCGCKSRKTSPPAVVDETPQVAAAPLDTTSSAVEAAASAETMTAVADGAATATLEEPPPKPSCGCGHHAAESAAPQGADAAAGGACKCQKIRWVRKTHAALGLLFGLFLVEHFTATALGLRPALFQQHIDGVHAILRDMPWLEALVFVPLVGLIPFGLFLLAKAGLRYDVKKCNRGGKLRFFLQRASAVVILLFIAFHLLTLRNWGPSFATAAAARNVAPAAADGSLPAAYATSVWQIWDFLPSSGNTTLVRLAVSAFYLLGMTAAIYHLANGLWTGAIAWGAAQTPVAQSRVLRLAVAAGIALLALGTLGWYAMIVAPWS